MGGTQGAQCLTVPVANPPLWHIRPGLCRHPKARACCLSCVVDASFFYLPSGNQRVTLGPRAGAQHPTSSLPQRTRLLMWCLVRMR